MVGTISEAIAVNAVKAGTWLAYADPDHQSITGMYGGWTTAVALAGVLNSSPAHAAPAAHRRHRQTAWADLVGPTVDVHLASELVIDAVVDFGDLRGDLIRRFTLAAGKDRSFSDRRHGVPPV